MIGNSIAGFLGTGAAAGGTASFESIATTTGSGASGTVTFSSIAGTYKALQIRVNMIGSVASSLQLNFNGDTAANYSMHGLFGNGTAASAAGSSSTSNIQSIGQSSATITTYPNVAIMDVIDYASTSKYKTVKVFGGFDKNAAGGEVSLTSGSWRSTSAVTSVTLSMSTGVFNTGTTIALYGVK
jgi:hypothetical protein